MGYEVSLPCFEFQLKHFPALLLALYASVSLPIGEKDGEGEDLHGRVIVMIKLRQECLEKCLVTNVYPPNESCYYYRVLLQRRESSK